MTAPSSIQPQKNDHDEEYVDDAPMVVPTVPPQRRSFAPHTPKWQRFVVSSASNHPHTSSSEPSSFPFQRQYSHVYHQRLAALKSRCWDSIRQHLTNDIVSSSSSSTATTAIMEVNRILELREDVVSWVVGTLVKESSSSSSSSKEDDHKDMSSSSSLSNKKRCRSTDYLVLEDESGRVVLDLTHLTGTSHNQKKKKTKITNVDNHHHNNTWTPVHQYCTGLVVGICGIVGMDGVMKVERIYHPKLVSHPTFSTTMNDDDNQDDEEDEAHVLLLSGLELGTNLKSTSLAREMLLTYLDGCITPQTQPQTHPQQYGTAKKICRVVIAGGSIAANPSNFLSSSSGKNNHVATSTLPSTNSTTTTTCPSPILELDAFCAQILAMGIPIDLIPGRDDPTTCTWPQRPLHSSLLPYCHAISSLANTNTNTNGTSSRKLSSKLFHPTPNPYAATWGKQPRFVIGTDGTNITDLVQHTMMPSYIDDEEEDTHHEDDDDDHLEKKKKTKSLSTLSRMSEEEEEWAMIQTLAWGHVCPTGPDTVPTIPHVESDPMVLQEMPHLYFMGNATRFFTKMVMHDKSLIHHNTTNNTTTTTTTQTRIIGIPKFSTRQQAVLVSLSTLDVQLLTFSTPIKS